MECDALASHSLPEPQGISIVVIRANNATSDKI